MVEWKDVVGKRVLLEYIPEPTPLIEAKVLELSPSGLYAKIKDLIENRIMWICTVAYKIVEVLE